MLSWPKHILFVDFKHWARYGGLQGFYMIIVTFVDNHGYYASYIIEQGIQVRWTKGLWGDVIMDIVIHPIFSN